MFRGWIAAKLLPNNLSLEKTRDVYEWSYLVVITLYDVEISPSVTS